MPRSSAAIGSFTSAKNRISKERSSPMKEGKYQKQKPQIRVNPRNLRHPRSIRRDEY